MGTVGVVLSIITVNSITEDFFLLMQGKCRFQLGVNISEEPVHINKIKTIENYKKLIGNY